MDAGFHTCRSVGCYEMLSAELTDKNDGEIGGNHKNSCDAGFAHFGPKPVKPVSVFMNVFSFSLSSLGFMLDEGRSTSDAARQVEYLRGTQQPINAIIERKKFPRMK